MHGLQTGASLRRISLVGVFMLVMLALATHVTVAQADTGITTSITSPSDPSFYYDSTDGAYGGFTVTGTTTGADPSTDTVDIDCYTDQAGTEQEMSTLVSGVALNSNGGFSVPVTYEEIENAMNGWATGCQLAAVPTSLDTYPYPSDLSTYTGPRILLSELFPGYGGAEQDNLSGYQLSVQALGASENLTDPGWCGLEDMYLNSANSFGIGNDDTFNCADGFGDASGTFTIGGATAVSAAEDDPSDNSLTLTTTQDPSNGDMTVAEVDPLDVCTDESCDGYTPSGVVDDRAITVASAGKLVVITDTFKSDDGQSHPIVDDVGTDIDLTPCCTAEPISYEFPGQSSYSAAPGESVDVGQSAPATIYAYNANPDATGEGLAAVTYFTPPSGGTINLENGDLVIPYDLTVPAGGSVSLSFAYATEYSQSGFAGDIASALDIQTPPTLAITSPAKGSSTNSSAVTVSGLATAASGIKSVAVNGVAATLSGSGFSAPLPLTPGLNTIKATVTTNSGAITSTSETVTYNPPGVEPQLQTQVAAAIWHPIADTGAAGRAGEVKEKLTGHVTAGSAAVSYYFQYGVHGHYDRRSKVMSLAAGKTSRHVALTIGGLKLGTAYGYRLVATGEYGHATGARRTFKVAMSGNH